MGPLEGQIALVTGASRGIGRGIALQLGQAGCTVYITGRKPGASISTEQSGLPSLEQTAKEIEDRGGTPIVVYCDHANSHDIENLFKQIEQEKNGQLDILVNNAYSAVPQILENAGKKFFECDPTFWDDMNEVGLRNSYFCSVYAARMMVKRRLGLIVNISSPGALQYFFNVPYGVGKAALDRMTTDMAIELKEYNINVVSLWPGFTKTEYISNIFNQNDDTMSRATKRPRQAIQSSFETAETPEFIGKAVVHLATDKNISRKSGKVLLTTDLASEYKFVDSNGQMPANMRSVRSTLQFFGWTGLAEWFPAFIKIPKQALHFGSYKF